MIERETLDEVARQADIWASAYRNVNKYNTDVAALQMQMTEYYDKIQDEEQIKESAQEIINALLADVEDTEENRNQIEDVLADKLGHVFVDGVIR